MTPIRLILTVAIVGLPLAAPALADEKPPYVDPNARGTITFCDAHRHEIRSGFVEDVPFAAYAVGSVKPKPPADTLMTSAILFAHQPRQGTYPQEWSGRELTAASAYSNVDHPMVAFTRNDYSMHELITAFPPKWDGYVELRMRYKAYGSSVSVEYAAADVRITGDVWTLVRGGGGPCDAGDARSATTVYDKARANGERRPKSGPDSLGVGLAAAAQAAKHPPKPGDVLPATVASATPVAPTPPAGSSGGARPGADDSSVSSRAGSGSNAALTAGVGLVAVVGVVAGVAIWRRRR